MSINYETLTEELPGLGDLVAQYIEAVNRHEAAKQAAKHEGEAIKRLEPLVLDAMLESGMQRITCNGRTVYTKTTARITAKADMARELLPILEKYGFADCASVNSNRLAAIVRELSEIPDPDENGVWWEYDQPHCDENGAVLDENKRPIEWADQPYQDSNGVWHSMDVVPAEIRERVNAYQQRSAPTRKG